MPRTVAIAAAGSNRENRRIILTVSRSVSVRLFRNVATFMRIGWMITANVPAIPASLGSPAIAT